MRIWLVIKRVILWSYERGTWQYDLLCFLILVFIFLTPSSFFIHRDVVPLGAHRAEAVRLTHPPAPVDPISKKAPSEPGETKHREGETKQKEPARSVKP